MTRGSAVDFLIRAVLDETFRDTATADPPRAFEGYDLNDEEREILQNQDERVLALLGQAVTRGEVSVAPSEKRGSSNTKTASPPVLPEVRLLLRLIPHVSQNSAPGSQLAYEASLHPWSGDLAPDAADGKPPAIEWIIRITPAVRDAQEAGLSVSYSASIQPFAVGAGKSPALAPESSQARSSSPWNHYVASNAAKTAAQAVRASDASERYEKLLDLINALQTGDAHD